MPNCASARPSFAGVRGADWDTADPPRTGLVRRAAVPEWSSRRRDVRGRRSQLPRRRRTGRARPRHPCHAMPCYATGGHVHHAVCAYLVGPAGYSQGVLLAGYLRRPHRCGILRQVKAIASAFGVQKCSADFCTGNPFCRCRKPHALTRSVRRLRCRLHFRLFCFAGDLCVLHSIALRCRLIRGHDASFLPEDMRKMHPSERRRHGRGCSRSRPRRAVQWPRCRSG